MYVPHSYCIKCVGWGLWVARMGSAGCCAQVKHRCHCADEAVCGAEAAMVERMAAEGLLTPNNGALDPGASPATDPWTGFVSPARKRVPGGVMLSERARRHHYTGQHNFMRFTHS